MVLATEKYVGDYNTRYAILTYLLREFEFAFVDDYYDAGLYYSHSPALFSFFCVSDFSIA